MHYFRAVFPPVSGFKSQAKLLAGIASLFLVMACSSPSSSPNVAIPDSESPSSSTPVASETPADGGELTIQFAEVAPIIEQRCAACHANEPSITRFGKPAGGVLFETPEQIKDKAPRIKARAVDTQSMPSGNLTEMTDAERQLLGKWIEQGANIN
jgi:uncharacterized membrane protein